MPINSNWLWKNGKRKENLEITVDFGKANHGGVLEGTVGFSETFESTHYLFSEFSMTHLRKLPNACDIDVEKDRKQEETRENERKRRDGLSFFLFWFWLMFQQGKNSPKCAPTMWHQKVVSFTIISSHEIVIYGAKIISFFFFFFFS